MLMYEEERGPKRLTLTNLSTDSDQVQADDQMTSKLLDPALFRA